MVTTDRVTAVCLECEDPFPLESQPSVGELITCPNCYTDLVVTGLKPLELDFYSEEDWKEGEEGWEEDEEDW